MAVINPDDNVFIQELFSSTCPDNIQYTLDPLFGAPQVTYATTAALPTCVYNNGTDGVGATLTASVDSILTNIDGVTPVSGSRILVKNQADAKQNGIYLLTNSGSVSVKWVLTRDVDYDTITKINATYNTYMQDYFVFIGNGNTLVGTGWILDNSTEVYLRNNEFYIGDTDTVFTQYTGTRFSQKGFMEVIFQ